MATVQKKTVLITGCSTDGIGWAMAKTFHERGFYVFATARDPSKVGHLAELSDVEILELDVTLPQTISRCHATVAQRTGGTLDVLVNNAGVEFVSPLLDVDITEAKRLYDVNVWGPLAMVQAFAPLLIAARGIVANQSSIDAALSMAFAGVFASSKAAVARLSTTLRCELEPLGVRVVTVMCGSVRTPMFDKPGGRLTVPESSYYYHARAAADKERMDHKSGASDVDVLAAQLVKDILAGPRSPVWRGYFAALVRFITWALPSWYVDRMVNSAKGLDQVKPR